MHKGHKRAIAMALALSLATTGCASKKEYQEKGYEKIQEIMTNNEFYQSKTYDETYEERYSRFYKAYYDTYIKYMSEEQYNKLLNIVYLMDEDERYDFPNVYRELNDMFDVWEFHKGRGLYASFNDRILSENIALADRHVGSIANMVNTLRSVVNNDGEFYTSLFSKDIDKLIKCIMKNTGCKDRELVEELIYKMDLYYDLRNSEEYMDKELMKAYEQRVVELIGVLIESKCSTDETFNNTLYATLLKGSAFCDESKYSVLPYLMNGTCTISIIEEDYSYTLYDVKSEYLYEDITIEELKRRHVNDILWRCIINDEKDTYSIEHTMQLLLCLAHAEGFNVYTIKEAEEFRAFLYNDLKDYFSSEEEFNAFILSLHNKSKEALHKYFKIFIERLKEDGITYEDFMRYTCLVNYNDEAKYTHITWQGSFEEMQANYVPDSELKLMKESEYENIIWPMEENYFIGTIDYKDYFVDIDALLANNDLGFNRIFNPDCQYNWENGNIEITNADNTQILSTPIKPDSLPYLGTNIIYYEIPEGYEESDAYELFPNYEGTLITRKLKGIKTTIENPHTGEDMLVFVAGLDTSLDNFAEIYFMQEYEPSKKNTVASLELRGGNYE